MVTLDLFIGRCYAVKYHGKVSLKRCKMAKIINREVVSDSYLYSTFQNNASSVIDNCSTGSFCAATEQYELLRRKYVEFEFELERQGRS